MQHAQTEIAKAGTSMTMTRRSALSALGAASLGVVLGPSSIARAVAGHSRLEAAIQRIIGRPEFKGARWGMAFYAPDSDEHIWSIKPDELFVPGSSAKVFIAGTAFSALGVGHRLRTRICHTGRLADGVLHGDLVVVAGGDLLIGGRLRRDGTQYLADPDHSYSTTPGAAAIPDPLAVLRAIAGQVAERGIERIAGRVFVDASLFRETTEHLANGGFTYTISPIVVNDSIVDVTVRPGQRVDAPAVIELSPQVGYVRVVNQVRTIAAGGTARNLAFVGDTANADGTRTVTLVGDIPRGTPSLFRAYYVPEPARFAALAFVAALRDRGIRLRSDPLAAPGAKPPQVREPLLEYVPPPLSEQVKPMLKVSSNVHTIAWPHIIGSIAGHDAENPEARYLERRGRLFERAGLDPSLPVESDGLYSPDFFVRFLAHMRRQPYYARYRSALPIMGRDGTLSDIEVDSPAAGRVHAKTGTAMAPGGPDPAVHKALAGFIRLRGGRTISFATLVKVPIASPSAGAEDLAGVTGRALGEIATAAYRHLS